MTQPLQNCIGPTIRIGQESWCLAYAGFFSYLYYGLYMCLTIKLDIDHFQLLNIIILKFNCAVLSNLLGNIFFRIAQLLEQYGN